MTSSYLWSRDLVVVIVTCVLCADVTSASSDFYYDNWQCNNYLSQWWNTSCHDVVLSQCNNYLSAESVVVQAAAGHLLEIHVRDDIPVSHCTHALSSTVIVCPMQCIAALDRI